MLVLVSCATLLLGVAQDDAEPIAISLAAAVASLVLLWAGVARSSGSSQGQRHS